MWRFVEEGPRLKFPLKNSPFMAADPMYREVRVAPPVRLQRGVRENHSSFFSSTEHTSSTVELNGTTEIDEIAPISKRELASSGSDTNPL